MLLESEERRLRPEKSGEYPAGVPRSFDFPKIPITHLLDDTVERFPQRIAMRFLGTGFSFRQLKSEVDRLATGLARLGVEKGDRVAHAVPKQVEFRETLPRTAAGKALRRVLKRDAENAAQERAGAHQPL